MLLAAAAALTLASVTLAEEPPPAAPYSPPQMSWGPSAPAGAGVDPAHAFSAYRGVDVGLGLLGGTLGGGGTAGLELELLADLDRVAGGLRMSLLGGGAVGVGLGVTAGARVPLSSAVRLDLLGDAGFTVYSLDDETVTPYGVSSTEDSTATLGLFAARVGITWEYRRLRYLRVGGIVRHVPPKTVTYQDTTCLTFLCGSATEEVTYGGTTIGGYLIFGGTAPSERRR